MRRGLLAALAVGMLAVGAPATAAGTPAPARVGVEGGERIYEVYRTSDVPRRLRMTIALEEPKHELSTIQSIALVRRGKGWAEMEEFQGGYSGYAEMGSGELWHRTYGPYRSPACPHPELCRSRLDGPLTFHIDSTKADRLTFFFQLTDVVGTATIHTPGFKLRETRKTKFRRVLGDEVATGVHGLREAYEHFTEASLPGGKYGSSAHALIPCDDAGRGTARLTGGVDQQFPNGDSETHLYCGTYPGLVSALWDGWPGGWDVAHKATTWRLKGDVIGASRARFRLAVFDYPKP